MAAMSPERHTRRAALAIGASSAGAFALTGCDSAEEEPKPKPKPQPQELAKLDDVPVGETKLVTMPGGKKLPGKDRVEQVVLTRTDEKTVNAYSNICTHAECLVKPKGEDLFCPCHNATFDRTTGEPKKGPPQTPLNKVTVHIAGDKIMTGSASDH